MAAEHPRSTRPARIALRRGAEPLYRQLADSLRDRIVAGEFAVSQPIPTEAMLAHGYRTSRITVRHALSLLEQEGLIHREQGRGSFVRQRAIAVGPRRLTSFTQELQERGVHQGSRLLSVTEVQAPAGVPLDLGASGRCVRVARVRRADDRPIAFQVTYVPSELGEDIEAALLDHGSLYAYLQARHGLRIDSADETYRVGAASSSAAELLELAPGAPVFIVERVGFARARRVEWTSSVVGGDDYEVHVHLKR